MLSSVLTTLQSLVPGQFVVSAFFPMLAFSVLNGLMLFSLNAPFRALALDAVSDTTAGRSSFLIAAGLIALAMLAYALSALHPTIQLLLEGRWPTWLASLFAPAQARRLEGLEEEVRANDRIRSGLRAIREGGKAISDDWKDRLRVAREYGSKSHKGQNNFTS